jgi:hypothetical protein
MYQGLGFLRIGTHVDGYKVLTTVIVEICKYELQKLEALGPMAFMMK